MPSEREIRKLYVNGLTICIEFIFCLFQIFSVRRRRGCHRRDNLGAWGLSLNKRFGWCNSAKTAEHVYVCIACQSAPYIMSTGGLLMENSL